MPSLKKKDIYIGKCLDDLNKLSDIKQLNSNAAVIVKSASKVFQDAEALDLQGDEEKAYVMYLKYFNIIKQVKTKADYKKQKDYFDKLIGQKNLIRSIDQAEKLAKSLKERYDLKAAEVVAKKLASVDVKSESTKKSRGKKDNVESAEPKPEEKTLVVAPVPQPGIIRCIDLYHLLQDSNTILIIMDVRPETDFNQSRISYTECISVPEEIIAPGSTVNHIQAKLPDESKESWCQRKNVDHIVLLDWKSRLENVVVGTPLKTLKDALYKFDMNTVIKSEPLVLEGGYEQWLLYYPTLTTNAHVARPSDSNRAQAPSPTYLLDFDYPDLDDSAQNPAATGFDQTPTTDDYNPAAAAMPSMPRFDRSLKPSKSSQSSSLSSSLSLNNGRGTALNNEQRASSSQSSLDEVDNPSSSTSSLYPSVSGEVKPKDKNINILKDNEANGPKSINLSFRNNVASDFTESVNHRKEKESELRNFQRVRDAAMKEDQQRVEEAERKLRDLEQMKKKEEKDVADLMRMKRKLREDLEEERRKQEDEKQRLAEEENERLLALEQAKQDEEEKHRRLAQIEKLREERKRKEQESEIAKRIAEEEEEERLRKHADEKAFQLKLAEEEKERTAALENKRLEEERKLESQRVEKERNDEKQREEEKNARLEKIKKQQEMEHQRREAEKAERLQKEKEEAARIEQEKRIRENMEKEAERKRIEEEQEKKRRAEMEAKRWEEAARAKAEKEKAAQQEALARARAAELPPSKTVPSVTLPTGWEKRLDKSTNRYFYIDHNSGKTQWTPPDVHLSARHKDATYTTRLKEEPSVSSSRGLSRSHSSPDIKKQLEDEEEIAKRRMPSIDRGNKPVNSPFKIVPKQTAYSVRKRDLNPVYGNVGPALTGLRNLGNTCYMNSTIQCLNNTSLLITYFITDNYLEDINRESSQGMHGEVVDDFACVVKALWSQQYRSITPRDLKNTVAKYNPMFAGYQQQDSQEFLTFLLDGLHEGLNEVKKAPDIPEQNNDNLTDRDAARIAWEHHKLLHKSVIVELFQGQLKSTLMCRTCKKSSVTFQAFMFLSLPIPQKSRCTLKDCVQEFLKPELMTGSSKWKCPRCKVERDSEKKIDIWKLPPILLVGLNRFYSEGMWMQKKTTYVDFPVTDLNLTPYIIGPPARAYNLYGISNHYGTMEGGHYTAFCRNPVNKKWYKFDDQDVYEMSVSDIKTSAAFVLYYTSREMPAPKYMPHL